MPRSPASTSGSPRCGFLAGYELHRLVVSFPQPDRLCFHEMGGPAGGRIELGVQVVPVAMPCVSQVVVERRQPREELRPLLDRCRSARTAVRTVIEASESAS